MCRGTLWVAAALTLCILCILAIVPARGSGMTLVPFGSPHRYTTLRCEAAYQPGCVPQDVYSTGYNDSAWPLGSAPFGQPDTLCVTVPVVTGWDSPDQTIVTRTWINLPTGFSNVVVHTRVAGCCILFCPNGVFIGSNETGYQPCPWHASDMDVTSSCHAGANLILLVAGTYGWRYLDISVTADLPTSIHNVSWGRLRTLYR